MSATRHPISATRKIYIARLIGRCLILLLCILLWVFDRQAFTVVEGWRFFDRFSVLHLLWLVWIADMLQQLFPIGKQVALGSRKNFASRFRAAAEPFHPQALRNHIVSATRSAGKVFLLWTAVVAVIGVLHHTGLLGTAEIFLICVFFYVCDLICVLIWCPFRILMKNRCCTTCRIFNWDHLMMFSPMLFIRGFFAKSLLLLSFVVWLAWELSVLLHPDRFWERSNLALRCSQCTDKLCTQYCHS